MKIPYNRPFFSGQELIYIADAVNSKSKISGNGSYTQWCQKFFEERYSVSKCLLTTSCTDALELAALLLDIQPGDEVIVPSFTFVSTANAFLLRGAKIIFADSMDSNPNVDPADIERKISDRTVAIVVVHYAGVGCPMDEIMEIAARHKVFVVEDAAQAVESTYKGRQLGTFGDLGAFSFHETKNVICGEGGLLAINNAKFAERAEVIWEKGTNRSAFFRGEVDKYNWIDIGSSFLPSDLNAAFLRAQLESIDYIQKKRCDLWSRYRENLRHLEFKGHFKLPVITTGSISNGHIFYIETASEIQREDLRKRLNEAGVNAVTHYLPLESSPYFQKISAGAKVCPNSDRFSKHILRLPLHYHLTADDIDYTTEIISKFFIDTTSPQEMRNFNPMLVDQI